MIEKLYKQYYDDYVRIMRRILKGDQEAAEDIVQDAFVKAIRNQDLFNPKKGTVRTWFNSIMFNSMRDYKRRAKEVDCKPHDNVSSSDLITDLSIKEREGLDGLIQNEIDKMKNEKHRKVLHLFFIKGYRIKQISDCISVSETNVTTIVTRFRKLLDDC